MSRTCPWRHPNGRAAVLGFAAPVFLPVTFLARARSWSSRRRGFGWVTDTDAFHGHRRPRPRTGTGHDRHRPLRLHPTSSPRATSPPTTFIAGWTRAGWAAVRIKSQKAHRRARDNGWRITSIAPPRLAGRGLAALRPPDPGAVLSENLYDRCLTRRNWGD
jgi:hypothetical protein